MKNNPYQGKFIAIEGLDGSGQTTQTALLKDFLGKSGCLVLSTKEPTIDSEAGKKIRAILDEKVRIEPMELQKLFTEDRRQHLVNQITPALQAGQTVISDRYYFSTFAFGASDGLGLEELIAMNDEFLLPDLTIILRVSPAVCIARIQKRGTPVTLFEKEQKLARVWKIYAIMPNRFPNTHIIDGERPIEEIAEEVKQLAQSTLNISKE